jgi:hypothetical protein
MTKPTVYLDTNIISAYWYSGVDVDGLARRGRTRDWWQHERGNFSVSVSAASEDELAAGKFRRQADCLRFARKLSFLTIDAKTRDFSATLVERGVVPAEKPGDALHMAVCAGITPTWLIPLPKLSWKWFAANYCFELPCLSRRSRSPRQT